MDIMSTIQPYIISATSFLSGIWQQGLQNFDLDKLIKGIIVYFLVVWAAFIIWVIKDITNRSTSILVQAFSIIIILVLTPIFGLPIYLLLRPGTTIGERYYEETTYLNEESEAEPEFICHACNSIVDREFRFCPECGSGLLMNCF
jgi:hypothetical protein